MLSEWQKQFLETGGKFIQITALPAMNMNGVHNEAMLETVLILILGWCC